MPQSYCATCNNTGFIDCRCGGDLCVCEQQEIECPECGGDPFYDDGDDYEEGFDAGEWNNPAPTVVNVGDDLHQILGKALADEFPVRDAEPNVAEAAAARTASAASGRTAGATPATGAIADEGGKHSDV